MRLLGVTIDAAAGPPEAMLGAVEDGLHIPLPGLTALVGMNGSGKSRLLELMEGVCTPRLPPIVRQPRLGDEPILPHGSVWLQMEGLDARDGDWPWLEALLSHLELDEMVLDLAKRSGGSHINAGIPDVWLAPRTWTPHHRDEESWGWIDGSGYVSFANHEDYLQAAAEHASDPREASPDGWTGFCRRLSWLLRREGGDPGEQAIVDLAWNIATAQGHPLIAVQLFRGGAVDLLWDPDQASVDEVEALAAGLSSIGSIAAEILLSASRPRRGIRPLLRLGVINEDVEFTSDDVASPITIHRMGDRATDPGHLVDRVLDERRPAEEPFWERGEEGRRSLSTWLARELRMLNVLIQGPMPATLTRGRPLRFRYLGPDDDQPEAPRTLVGLGDDDASMTEWSMHGAGTRRWMAAAVERRLTHWLPSAPSESSPIELMIVDEPELHLHPTAQREVADWLASQVDDRTSVLVATHSHAFLDVDQVPVELLGVVRTESRTDLLPLRDDLLDALGRPGDGLLESLGLDRAAAVALTKGVLIVEGHDDRRVIRHFFGEELDRARIRVLPIHGTKNTEAFATGELWGTLGVPLCLLFDDTRDDPGDRPTSEERQRQRLLDQKDHWLAAGFIVGAVSFPLPDIIVALPEAVIRRPFPNLPNAFSWSATIADWREQPPGQPGGFKRFALRRMNLDSSSRGVNDLVTRSLAACTADDAPSPELDRAVRDAISQLTGR